MNGSAIPWAAGGIAVNSAGLFVATGCRGPGVGSTPAYATSTDGSTWTTPAAMNGSTIKCYMASIAVSSSGKFVAVGYDTFYNYTLYATSTDGSTWTTPAQMNSYAQYLTMLGVTVNSSGVFVAVGYNGPGYYAVGTGS
jgi:hypothetical protein